MTVMINKSTLDHLQSSPGAILVHTKLLHLVPTGVKHCDIVPFSDHGIGPSLTGAMSLPPNRLPTSILLIIDNAPSVVGAGFIDALKESGVPIVPPLVTLGRLQRIGGAGRLRVASAVAEALSHALGSDVYSPLEMNRQILQLRQCNEDHLAKIDRMKLMLSQVGFHGEIVIDNLATLGLQPQGLPLSEPVRRSLRAVQRISIYETAKTPGQVSVTFSVGSNRSSNIIVETLGRRGWLDLDVPQELIASAQDSVVTIEALGASQTFLGQNSSVAMRFWWDTPSEENSITTRYLQLPKPIALSKGTSKAPMPLLRGLWLEQGMRVALATSDPFPSDLEAVVVPHTPATRAYTTSARGSDVREVGELITSPVEADGRYDLFLISRERSPRARLIHWKSATAAPMKASQVTSFATSRFATLHSLISFADGPVEELHLNSQVGFPILAASDGHAYLQTHPVEGRITGARLDDIVPVGTTRLWLDVENAHPEADAIEFIVVITKEPIPESVEAWILNKELPPYDDMHLTDLRGNELMCRVFMPAGTERTLDLQLPEPLPFQGQLYCLVNCRFASNRYGWCRWHNIAFAVDRTEPLPVANE